MAHRLTKQAITTYIPAVQAVLARPGYWEAYTTRELVTKYTTSGETASGLLLPIYGFVIDKNGRKTQGIVGYAPQTVIGGKPYTVYENVVRYRYYEAVAGVQGRDATVNTDPQVGWNAGAHSVAVADGDFLVKFTVPANVAGVLVGLADPSTGIGAYGTIEHGLRFMQQEGRPWVVEHGIEQLQPFFEDSSYEISISRVDGVVTYRKGDLHSYRSPNRSEGPKVLSAVLYSASDYVDNPSIGPVVVMSSVGDWDWQNTFGTVAMRARASWGWDGRATVGDGRANLSFDFGLRASQGDYASAKLVMDEPTISSRFGFIAVDFVSVSLVIPVDMVAIGEEVEVGRAFGVFDLSTQGGEYDYANASMAMSEPEVWGLSIEAPANQADAADAFFAFDNYSFDPTIYALISEGIRAGGTIDLLISIDADLAEHLALMTSADAPMILRAMIDNKIKFSDSLANINRMLIQYATNLATGAVGRYDGFNFEGFCRLGMTTFGFRGDGLYRIGADDDNGELVSAMLELAADDFGTAQGKRVGNVFLGLATDGDVYVRLVVDDQTERTYRAYQRRAEHRADFAKGAKSRFWRLRLEITDASQVELDNVEWVLAPTGRRT
jgi:hypothetical protein